MKKINDSPIYFWTGITTAALALLLALVSLYSIVIMEPKIKSFLSSQENISRNFKSAYLLLRDPQVFARYEFFDEPAGSRDVSIRGKYVKEIITAYDRKFFDGKDFSIDDKNYLELLLDRRKRGASLGRNSAVFLFVLSLLSWGLFFYEKRQNQL
jgi:hypothetical protein